MKSKRCSVKFLVWSASILSAALSTNLPSSNADASVYHWAPYRSGHVIYHRNYELPFSGGWYFRLGSFYPSYVCRGLWNDSWYYGWADTYRCHFGYGGYSQSLSNYYVLSGVRGLMWQPFNWGLGWDYYWGESWRFSSRPSVNSRNLNLPETMSICRATFQGTMYSGYRDAYNCRIAVGELEVVVPAGEFEVLMPVNDIEEGESAPVE